MSEFNLESPFLQACQFLQNCETPYLIIGGVAEGILGEPRMTGDLDLLIFAQPKELDSFLKKAVLAGFKVNQEKAISEPKKDFVLKCV